MADLVKVFLAFVGFLIGVGVGLAIIGFRSHQPLIVAKPPWYRRSLRGWNPFGWRSLMLDPLPDEPVVTAVGYYRPGDRGGGLFYWDADCETKPNGLDPELDAGRFQSGPAPIGITAFASTQEGGQTYLYDASQGAWIPDDRDGGAIIDPDIVDRWCDEQAPIDPNWWLGSEEMIKRDLGTYWVRVEFVNARGFLMKWETGHRYTHGDGDCKPPGASLIEPTFEDEEEIFRTIEYMFNDGNYSCDCNLGNFIARAHQEPNPDMPCGETLNLVRLTAIRPDMTECLLWEDDSCDT